MAKNPTKAQQAKWNRTWYEKNRTKRLAIRSEQRRAAREFIQKQKAKPCVDCDAEYPYYVMDFHHRPGEKKDNVLARAVGLCWSIARIEAEIAKCDLLCSNCHRIRTFNER